ncbi:MAG: helix-turn-helix transcriptional regulator [Sphingobium sp.]|nr:helix-turn-helix transcriptional regulator [Sphingobium sp.]MBP6111656.1 helix-turn-helix transcriptional regulator [Sphingobium sp.]MBP8672332.1 helix-turn-helix transcriptional regulator [Sphingobium sp.]MBP9158184.1 helix-turn-helix transcriptional regulator [Sphingobium sp.]
MDDGAARRIIQKEKTTGMTPGAGMNIVGRKLLAQRDEAPLARSAQDIPLDPYRSILFPNAIRERRLAAGLPSLLALSHRLPQIPYIRLSKIERGEVFARAEELRTIGRALDLSDAADLLLDVDAPGFAIEQWAGDRAEGRATEQEAEQVAMLLAAALRRLRTGRPALTLALLLKDYRLPPVIISRLENATKPFFRWNEETVAALCTLFEVADRAGLVALLWRAYESGVLAEWLARIPGRSAREARTRERISALRMELARTDMGEAAAAPCASPRLHGAEVMGPALPGALPVLGVPLGEGLIEPFPNPQHVIPPPGCGPQAYALRMCRASLGAAIPGAAVLIVDPGRAPVQGGLAVLKEKEGLRVLALSTDPEGRLIGHSTNPPKTIMLDSVAPADLAQVTAVLFP